MTTEATSANGDAAEKAGLSPFDIVTVFDGTILSAIKHLAAAVGVSPTGTDPEGWRATARNTGTHTLKMADSKIGGKNTDVWIFDPDPDCAPTTRTLRTYAYDGKYSRLAKILLVPFTTPGANQPRTLIDLLAHGQSQEARTAFTDYFGADALAGLDQGLKERATASAVKGASSLKARTVYVPDGVGGYVLATPVMSTDAYVALTHVRQRMIERKARVDLRRVRLSGKAQNVSLHAGARAGILTRLRARAPEPPSHRPAMLQRFLVSGRAPLPPRDEIEARLDAVLRLLSVIDGHGDRPGYVNADIQRGLKHAVDALVALAHEHVQDTLDDALSFAETDPSAPDAVHTSIRPVIAGNGDERAILAVALARQVITNAAQRAARGRPEALADRTATSVLDIRVTASIERECKRLVREGSR